MKRLEVNEWLVVYLFCKFHERLGFERILNLQDSYPDCIAEKEGKQVTIEFETKSYFLQNHLKVAEYLISWGKEVIEKENEYVAVEAGTLFPNGTWRPKKPPKIIKEYPKSKYRIAPSYAGNVVQVFTKNWSWIIASVGKQVQTYGLN